MLVETTGSTSILRPKDTRWPDIQYDQPSVVNDVFHLLSYVLDRKELRELLEPRLKATRVAATPARVLILLLQGLSTWRWNGHGRPSDLWNR